MAYRVLVLDIDGTLTNSEKVITDNTLRALMRAQEQGVRVVLASGRPTPGIMPLAEKLQLARYGGFILSFNGAIVTDCGSGQVVFQTTLPVEEIPRLYQSAQDNKVCIISYKGGAIITEDKENPYVAIEARINSMPVVEVESFLETITHPVTKCLMVGDGDYLAEVEKRVSHDFGSRLSVYRSEPFFLEIMPQHIDKAYSLGKLLDYLTLSREEMIACGDGFNDLSMIKFAGLGVAMGNAQQVVKESADYVTLSNDEDGVAEVIEKYILQDDKDEFYKG